MIQLQVCIAFAFQFTCRRRCKLLSCVFPVNNSTEKFIKLCSVPALSLSLSLSLSLFPSLSIYLLTWISYTFFAVFVFL